MEDPDLEIIRWGGGGGAGLKNNFLGPSGLRLV